MSHNSRDTAHLAATPAGRRRLRLEQAAQRRHQQQMIVVDQPDDIHDGHAGIDAHQMVGEGMMVGEEHVFADDVMQHGYLNHQGEVVIYNEEGTPHIGQEIVAEEYVQIDGLEEEDGYGYISVTDEHGKTQLIRAEFANVDEGSMLIGTEVDDGTQGQEQVGFDEHGLLEHEDAYVHHGGEIPDESSSQYDYDDTMLQPQDVDVVGDEEHIDIEGDVDMHEQVGEEMEGDVNFVDPMIEAEQVNAIAAALPSHLRNKFNRCLRDASVTQTRRRETVMSRSSLWPHAKVRVYRDSPHENYGRRTQQSDRFYVQPVQDEVYQYEEEEPTYSSNIPVGDQAAEAEALDSMRLGGNVVEDMPVLDIMDGNASPPPPPPPPPPHMVNFPPPHYVQFPRQTTEEQPEKPSIAEQVAREEFLPRRCPGCDMVVKRHVYYHHLRSINKYGACNAITPKRFKCNECDERTSTIEKLCEHMLHLHQTPTHIIVQEFDTEEEFEAFLFAMERRGGGFRKSRGVKKAKRGVVQYYRCSRNTQKEKNKGKDPFHDNGDDIDVIGGVASSSSLMMPKVEGEDKEDDDPSEDVCTAFIIKAYLQNGKIEARYCDFHTHNDGRVHLPKQVRNRFQEMWFKRLPPSVMYNVIMNELHLYCSPKTALERRLKSLTEEEINNILTEIREMYRAEYPGRNPFLDNDVQYRPRIFDQNRPNYANQENVVYENQVYGERDPVYGMNADPQQRARVPLEERFAEDDQLHYPEGYQDEDGVHYQEGEEQAVGEQQYEEGQEAGYEGGQEHEAAGYEQQEQAVGDAEKITQDVVKQEVDEGEQGHEQEQTIESEEAEPQVDIETIEEDVDIETNEEEQGPGEILEQETYPGHEGELVGQDDHLAGHVIQYSDQQVDPEELDYFDEYDPSRGQDAVIHKLSNLEQSLLDDFEKEFQVELNQEQEFIREQNRTRLAIKYIKDKSKSVLQSMQAFPWSEKSFDQLAEIYKLAEKSAMFKYETIARELRHLGEDVTAEKLFESEFGTPRIQNTRKKTYNAAGKLTSVPKTEMDEKAWMEKLAAIRARRARAAASRAQTKPRISHDSQDDELLEEASTSSDMKTEQERLAERQRIRRRLAARRPRSDDPPRKRGRPRKSAEYVEEHVAGPEAPHEPDQENYDSIVPTSIAVETMQVGGQEEESEEHIDVVDDYDTVVAPTEVAPTGAEQVFEQPEPTIVPNEYPEEPAASTSALDLLATEAVAEATTSPPQPTSPSTRPKGTVKRKSKTPVARRAAGRSARTKVEGEATVKEELMEEPAMSKEGQTELLKSPKREVDDVEVVHQIPSSDSLFMLPTVTRTGRRVKRKSFYE